MSLILSLDLKNLETANDVIAKIQDHISHIKIGHIAMSNFDVTQLKTFDKPIVLDLKFFDILSTVNEAIIGYQKLLKNVEFFTISAACSKDVIEMSLKHKAKPFFVLHLSSDSIDVDITSIIRRAEEIIKLGGKSFICPPFLIKRFRDTFGDEVLLATPGVRNSYESNDHKSTITALEAKKLKTNFIIVGRPILSATDPTKASEEYYDQFISI